MLTLTELYRHWMQARTDTERAEEADMKAREDLRLAEEAEKGLANLLAEQLLAGVPARVAGRQRSRLVSLGGEVLRVEELGVDRPGEFSITPLAVDLVHLDPK